MAAFEVTGGGQIGGEITPQGAKNEALEVICAALLTDKRVEIRNIPDILDVNCLLALLQNMGVKVERPERSVCVIEAADINLRYLESDDYSAKAASLRGSVMLIGPLLARFGRARTPKPGGDRIGRRHIDTHLSGFEQLGAQFSYSAERTCYYVEAKRLRGCRMLLEEASVTATANILMASALAEGETVIYNAACEPYIQQLCRMLIKMGADISGVGSNLLSVRGVKSLGGVQHTLLPDMIEVGSFIGIAAMTHSSLTIKDTAYGELGIIPDAFRKLGIRIERSGDDIHVPQQDIYEVETFADGSIMTVADAPWPGLTPDLISTFVVLAAQARGSVLIHQKMFESRLYFVDKLIDMGAQIILCDPHRVTVIGNENLRLRPIIMTSPDIRAGVALLTAAMRADGVSTIQNIEQIDRGYQDIDKRLNAVGAKIKRI